MSTSGSLIDAHFKFDNRATSGMAALAAAAAALAPEDSVDD